jgi:hypothetical protein
MALFDNFFAIRHHSTAVKARGASAKDKCQIAEWPKAAAGHENSPAVATFQRNAKAVEIGTGHRRGIAASCSS